MSLAKYHIGRLNFSMLLEVQCSKTIAIDDFNLNTQKSVEPRPIFLVEHIPKKNLSNDLIIGSKWIT